jgi:hypothetical protein
VTTARSDSLIVVERAELRASQVGALKIDAAEISTTQVGAAQRGSVQVGAAQVGSNQLCIGQPCVAEVGSPVAGSTRGARAFGFRLYGSRRHMIGPGARVPASSRRTATDSLRPAPKPTERSARPASASNAPGFPNQTPQSATMMMPNAGGSHGFGIRRSL